MSTADPFLFDKNLKPFDGSVVGVQHDHGECRQLGRTIPSITTVHQNRGFVTLYLVSNPHCPSQNYLEEEKCMS